MDIPNHKKDIPNFEHIELSPNKLTSKAKGRSSGGLIIYYKTYLQQHIKVIRKAKSHIWLEINKEIFYDAPNNLKICLAYIPPQESLYYSDELFQDLVDDIIDLTTENEDFLVMGDFNARTTISQQQNTKTTQQDSTLQVFLTEITATVPCQIYMVEI